MPTLRATDAPISLRLDVGQALTVTAATGSSARVFDPLDNSPDSTVSGASSTFGPYSVPQNLQIRCSAGAVSFSVSGTGASGLSLAQEAAVASLASVSGAGIAVGASRDLTDADNGAVLECTATVSLTVPTGLAGGFACAIIPSGTTSIVSGGGTLLNGATTTLTRAAASNTMFAIQQRASASNSYVVSGA